MPLPDLVVRLALAGLIGLAVGIEREWSGHASGPGARFAGVRTFFLLGLLGGIAGWLYTGAATALAALPAGFIAGSCRVHPPGSIVKCRPRARQGGVMKPDHELHQDIMTQLDLDPSIRDEDIAVRVKDGVATLAGTVDDYPQRWAAERAVEQVPGIRAIVNELAVKLPGEHARTDSEIAHAALNALRWDVQAPDRQIKVKVVDGWIMLEGEVEWNYQRDAASRAVRYLTGVKGVSNMLQLRKVASADDVKHRITEMLRRQAEIDAGQITVEVAGHDVRLRGTVRSLNEKRDAERAVWNIPGVTRVENELLVSPAIGAGA